MPGLLLIDINVLGIGSMRENQFQHRSHRGKETGAIHGTFSKLSGILEVHRNTIPVVLWDDRCRWREEILPQYERHRWDFDAPDAAGFKSLCKKWGLNAISDSWQGFVVPRQPGRSVVKAIRTILEAAA